MSQRAFRYPDKMCTSLALQLFEFEASKVAGPGSSRRKLTDVMWTVSEVKDAIRFNDEEERAFNRLLRHLLKENQLMRIPGAVSREDSYITRTAETLRIIGHTYEYWNRGRPGVDAVRWEIVPKVIPVRNIEPEDFIRHVIQGVSKASARDESETKLGEAIQETVSGIVSHFRDNEKMPNPKFSKFQLDATVHGICDAFGYGKSGSVLVAGVGSGKTLAFMLPPLILVKHDMKIGKKGAHLFLYPRKALSLDQFSKSLVPFAVAAGVPTEYVHSEMGMYYREHYSSVYRGIEQAHSTDPPRLIISSLETLKNRLSHPKIVNSLLPRLKTVTLDEIHLHSGVQGAQVAMLMRRLRTLSSHQTKFIGASATIAKPEEHFSRLMGIDSTELNLITPEADEMEMDGVVHHSFIRPSGVVSQAGTLVNATSLMIHHRRDDLSDRPGPEGSKHAPKTLCFADNLEILGAWNDDLRENERTDEYEVGRQRRRQHPDSNHISGWSRDQREIPYASRFQKPLERRIEAQGGVDPETEGAALLPVFQEWRGKNVCGRCKDGERFELGHADIDVMEELSKLVHRAPHKADDAFKPFRIRNSEIFSISTTVGTMDMCPFMQAGACTWFTKSPVGEAKRIGNSRQEQPKYDFADRATSWIQSSKSEDASEADDLAGAVFRAPASQLNSLPRADGDDFVDVVMASPSLEVGIDLPNVTESVMTRAVRNIASYRQKAGRIGRESNSEALNITLATDSANDLHYYRQPRKLIDRGRLEPVPLKERNEAVAHSTGYLAVWDWIVKHNETPEGLRASTKEKAHMLLDSAKTSIDDYMRRTEIHTHLSNVLGQERYPVGTEWFDTAIDQVRNELELLLRPVSGFVFTPVLPSGTSLISAIRHLRGDGQHPNQASPERGLDEAIEELDDAKNRLNERRRNLGPLSDTDANLLERIDEMLSESSPTPDDLLDLADDVNRARRKPENEGIRGDLRRFGSGVEDYSESVEKLNSIGVDIQVFKAVEQYMALMENNEISWKSYYFSAILRTLDVFKELRQNRWFVSPDALYIHPHMRMVKLVDKSSGGSNNHRRLREDQSLVPVHEALHSYLPGMWTRRLPQATFKVLAEVTTTLSPTGLLSNIDSLERAGFKYETVAKSLPPPPGQQGDISVLMPLEIPVRPRADRKLVTAAKLGPEILDFDEGSPTGRDTKRQRMPRSFTQRWLHIGSLVGRDIHAYAKHQQNQRLVQTTSSGDIVSEITASELEHPFANAAFSSVQWVEDATVTEYVFALNRTNSTGGSELVYRNARGAGRAFGQRINTEGIRFTLKQEAIQDIQATIIRSMKEGNNAWSPSLIRAFRSFLKVEALDDDQPVSNFVLDDVVGVLMALWNERGQHPLSPDLLGELTEALLNEPGRFDEFVELRVDAKLRTPPEGDPSWSDQDEEERQGRKASMLRTVRAQLGIFSARGSRFETYLELWLHRTVLMSFGVACVGAMQRLSGGDSNEIGYGLTDVSWNGNDTTILVFDRAECGNGNVSVAKEFMHIPNIIRTAQGSRGGFLPTLDFLSTLEEVLLPCAQFHCDVMGMEYQRTGGEDSVLHKSLVDLKEFGREIYRIGSNVWSTLGVHGPEDGWKLPLLNAMRKELALVHEIEQDDVVRSTKVCWNGCPECIERIDVVQGGFTGMDFLDKAVMDEWFRSTRNHAEEYTDLVPDGFLTGSTGLRLGDLHSLVLEQPSPESRVRSLMLPWNIGVDVDRSNFSEGVKMILRESDIVGMMQSQANQGVAIGMPSSAFKRLLWFDLLMTAYLDMRGAFETSHEKRIQLAYYDARDITFDDIGLAPQLLESLMMQARKDGISSINRFSDVLLWLAKRGFSIQLCVDRRVRLKPQNQPVRDFLSKLQQKDASGNIQLSERNVRDNEDWQRSMHKKTVITPCFVLKGTANLTRSGSLNEEDVDHIMRGTAQFDSMQSSVADTLAQSSNISDE
jgi:hypothetical protein